MAGFPTIDARIGELVLELVRGCTFDDFILAPQYSVLPRRDPDVIDLSCQLTRGITLRRPIVSANMDTVTRAPMAVVQAEEGGIGIIDRGYRPGEIEPQVREVEKVKRTQHGVIADPYSIGPDVPVSEARALMSRSRVGTLVVVDAGRRLLGLLTERDLRFVDGAGATVADRMTPFDRLVVHRGSATPEEAERVMVERKVKKLPLVDDQGVLNGLVTAKDLMRQQRRPFATRDAQGRLMVGAAIGATGDYLERASELVRAGVDVLVIDIAHGHSVVMDRAMREFRRRFPDVQVIAGNVATAEGTRFLIDRGADGVKVGIGPGRRLHDAHHHQLWRAAGAGAGGMPPRGRRVGRADHRRRRHQAAWRAGRSAALRRRLRDARQRVCRHGRSAGRGRAQGSRPARVAEDRQGAVQGAARHGVHRSDPRSPGRRGSGHARARSHRRRRHGDQRAGARLGADRSSAT